MTAKSPTPRSLLKRLDALDARVLALGVALADSAARDAALLKRVNDLIALVSPKVPAAPALARVTDSIVAASLESPRAPKRPVAPSPANPAVVAAPPLAYVPKVDDIVVYTGDSSCDGVLWRVTRTDGPSKWSVTMVRLDNGAEGVCRPRELRLATEAERRAPTGPHAPKIGEVLTVTGCSGFHYRWFGAVGVVVKGSSIGGRSLEVRYAPRHPSFNPCHASPHRLCALLDLERDVRPSTDAERVKAGIPVEPAKPSDSKVLTDRERILFALSLRCTPRRVEPMRVSDILRRLRNLSTSSAAANISAMAFGPLIGTEEAKAHLDALVRAGLVRYARPAGSEWSSDHWYCCVTKFP